MSAGTRQQGVNPTATTNRKAPRQIKRRRLLLIGPLIVVTLLLIPLAEFALNRMNRHSTSVYELAAVRILNAVNTAQIQYRSTYGRYAQSLQALGPPPHGESPSETAGDLIPEPLTTGAYAGFVFTMAVESDGYTVNADPKAYGEAHSRSLYTDHTNVIRWHSANEPASESDPAIQ